MITLALLTTMALHAHASPDSAAIEAPREIVDPDWRRVRDTGDPMRFYPERAQRLSMQGSAVMSCVVTADGFLKDCKVLEETPGGYGFGEAAIRMAILFRMKPLTKSGQPV